MDFLIAATARDVGYWGNMLLTGVICVALLFVGTFAAAKSRRVNSARMEELEGEREADLRRDGPPRFNG